MEQGNRTRIYIAALAVVAAVCGAAVGVALILAWGGGGRAGLSSECSPGPELRVRLEQLAQQTEETRMELDDLRTQVDEILIGVAALAGDTAAKGALRSALPPPYVKEVEQFFTTQAARNLLTPKLQKKPGLKMGKPVFVTRDLITVPYQVSGKSQYLLVEIKSIDLYNLQFDVVWDSIEGETSP